MPTDGQGPSGMLTGPAPEGLAHRLADVLAKKYQTESDATQMAKRAGYPGERLPRFDRANSFWDRVIEDAENGIVPGKMLALVDEALRTFKQDPDLLEIKKIRAPRRSDDEREGPREPDELRERFPYAIIAASVALVGAVCAAFIAWIALGPDKEPVPKRHDVVPAVESKEMPQPAESGPKTLSSTYVAKWVEDDEQALLIHEIKKARLHTNDTTIFDVEYERFGEKGEFTVHYPGPEVEVRLLLETGMGRHDCILRHSPKADQVIVLGKDWKNADGSVICRKAREEE